MVIDQYLMLHSNQPILRFYGWSSPTLSFGKGNVNTKEIDLEFCKQYQIDLIKRPTGGKTVFHEFELTYAFVVPAEQFPKKILETYQIISSILKKSFEKYGIICEMKKMEKVNSFTDICFKEVSSYELTVNEKKLVGSAQYRNRNAILQHGSILLRVNYFFWNQIWKLPKNSDAISNRVTSFHKLLSDIPSVQEISNNIIKTFSEFFNAEILIHPLTSNELDKISVFASKHEMNYKVYS